MTIRRAQAEDAAAIAAIVRELGWFANVNDEPVESTVDRIVQHLALCDADNSHSVYVAEVEGAVKGYAAVHWCPYLLFSGPEGYVSELFVANEARGQGLGTNLLKVIEDEGRSRGCSRLGLLNMRDRESYKRDFYKNHGWVERPQVANFIYKLI